MERSPKEIIMISLALILGMLGLPTLASWVFQHSLVEFQAISLVSYAFVYLSFACSIVNTFPASLRTIVFLFLLGVGFVGLIAAIVIPRVLWDIIRSEIWGRA